MDFFPIFIVPMYIHNSFTLIDHFDNLSIYLFQFFNFTFFQSSKYVVVTFLKIMEAKLISCFMNSNFIQGMKKIRDEEKGTLNQN